MMFSLFNEPRNWKWMIPAALVAPCFFWWNDWVMAGAPWSDLAIIPMGLAFVLGIAALVNLILYAYHHWALMYTDVQSVRSTTPEVRMFEAAKGMHPEAVKALLLHRKSVWRIKYVPEKDLVTWIFDEMPGVHAGFVDFALDHSTGRSLMSKGLLSQGSKQFDPEGIVTDYEQYDGFISWLQALLIVTQAYGNQAPQWLPPWTPELVRHRLGLDGAPYAAEEEGLSDAMQAVMRAQAKWQGNGKEGPKEIVEPVQPARESKPQADDGPGLSDEELEATQQIQAQHDARWKLPNVEEILRTGEDLNRKINNS